MFYDNRTDFVRHSYECCTTIARMLYDNCTSNVRQSYDCCTNIVPKLYANRLRVIQLIVVMLFITLLSLVWCTIVVLESPNAVQHSFFKCFLAECCTADSQARSVRGARGLAPLRFAWPPCFFCGGLSSTLGPPWIGRAPAAKFSRYGADCSPTHAVISSLLLMSVDTHTRTNVSS